VPLASLALGFAVLTLLGWGAGALWIEVGGSADLEAVSELAGDRTAELSVAARVLTWAGSAYVLVPLAAICCLLFVLAGLRSEAFAVGLSLAGAILLADVVKLLVGRARPPIEHLQAVTGPSFPSAHATQASAFWLSIVLALRAARVGRVAYALLCALAAALVFAIGLSRVYLGVHYPGDVVAGILLGAGWAAFVAHRMRSAARSG
jgi:undecaprenyl-diphosphatase